MEVNGIRDRIVELGHQAAGDEEVRTRALGWLNAAYHELMDDVVAYLPAGLQRLDEVVTDVDGKAVLPVEPYKVLRVVDKVAGNGLAVVSKSVVLDVDPAGVATGFPARCVVQGAEVRVHPVKEGVVLRVLHVPVVADLAEGGSEASILLPKAHHSALVWGGLVWSALFERGFASSGEMVLFQRNWQEAKERVKMALLGGSGEVLRVAPHAFV